MDKSSKICNPKGNKKCKAAINPQPMAAFEKDGRILKLCISCREYYQMTLRVSRGTGIRDVSMSEGKITPFTGYNGIPHKDSLKCLTCSTPDDCPPVYEKCKHWVP